MNKIIVLLALCLSTLTVSAGERWIAKCTDDKNVHYVQNYKGVGHLLMVVSTPFGDRKIFPMATLKQSKSTPFSICGAVMGNPDPQGHPISQVCMNRDRQIIYMKFDHPNQNGFNSIEEGMFCKAEVRVISD